MTAPPLAHLPSSGETEHMVPITIKQHQQVEVSMLPILHICPLFCLMLVDPVTGAAPWSLSSLGDSDSRPGKKHAQASRGRKKYALYNMYLPEIPSHVFTKREVKNPWRMPLSCVWFHSFCDTTRSSHERA